MAERVSLPDGPIKFRWVAFVHGRPMVDSRCQGRGIGRAAMGLVAEDVRHKGVALVLLVPFVPVYGSQERFYLRLGLHPTGRSQDGEVVLELPLASITAWSYGEHRRARSPMGVSMFLHTPPANEARTTLYSRDIADDGYVANLTRLWAWRPDVFEAFGRLRKLLAEHAALSIRERSILVCATAANLSDSYCALAWGPRLAVEATPDAAAAVLQRKHASELSARENALANWAHQVVRAPNAIGSEDVDRLRAVGLTDEEIFDATAFIAFRIAFSTVNDALGAHPDSELAAAAPAVVRDAVTYGRRVSETIPKHA